jgi:hypothetical protein
MAITGPAVMLLSGVPCKMRLMSSALLTMTNPDGKDVNMSLIWVLPKKHTGTE